MLIEAAPNGTQAQAVSATDSWGHRKQQPDQEVTIFTGQSQQLASCAPLTLLG